MKTIAVLALHGMIPFDFAIPSEVFGRVERTAATAGYEVRVFGEAPEVRVKGFEVRAPWGLADLAGIETVIVPGLEDPGEAPSPSVVAAVRSAAAGGARVVSICTGAFVLAAAGLLDGLTATTHWRAAELLAKRYPAVSVDPDVLFIDHGHVLTSAGASAGLDLCLHMVRRDYGQAAAAQAARLAVAPLERGGGQAQYLRRELPGSHSDLAPLLAWMEANADRPLNVTELASRAATTPRTLTRRFREQTGTTPLQWLLIARLRRAQELLETSQLSIDQVAAAAGFDAVSLRHRFNRELGVSPHAYRRAFNPRGASS